MTLEALAFKSSVSLGALGRIENARASAAWSTVRRIAEALDVKMADLGALIDAEQV
jgi:transcriptional regulator with XRE-family HTH domain